MIMWCAIATDKGHFVKGGVMPVAFRIKQDTETHARYITERLGRVVEKKGWLQYLGPCYGRTKAEAKGLLNEEMIYEFR